MDTPASHVTDDHRLAPTFVAIVLVQIVVMLGLYWLGRHFG